MHTLNTPYQSEVSALCDANWGPQDASTPKTNAPPVEQSLTSLRSISGWMVLHNGAPISWGCARHKTTAQSSCEAEVHSINETKKLLKHLKFIFRDINLPINYTIPIHNDNKGAIDWSKGTTTKKMRWIDMRENFVQENVISYVISVHHVPGDCNTSDIFTKEFRDSTKFLNARDSLLADTRKFHSLNESDVSPPYATYKDALTNDVHVSV